MGTYIIRDVFNLLRKRWRKGDAVERYGAWANHHVAQMKPEAKGDWVRYADAQATVEALQREHNEAGEALERQVRMLTDALDAEREKVKGLEDKLDLFLSAEHIMTVSWKGKVADRDKQLADLQAQLSALQGLVRKFVDSIQPVDYVEVDELLREARVTLDTTTPATKGGDSE